MGFNDVSKHEIRRSYRRKVERHVRRTSAELAADVAAFQAAGGKIDVLSAAATGEPPLKWTPRK